MSFRILFQKHFQPQDKFPLRFIHLFQCLRHGEKQSPVDLGEGCLMPERGGHSNSKVLLFTGSVSSQSPANAHACTVLPLFCFTEPRGINSPCGRDSCFFRELAYSRVKRVFIGEQFRLSGLTSTRYPCFCRTALRDGPAAPGACHFESGTSVILRLFWGIYPVSSGVL